MDGDITDTILHVLFLSYVCSFQAASGEELQAWIEALTTAILTGLDTRQQTIARDDGKKANSQVAVIYSKQSLVCMYFTAM